MVWSKNSFNDKWNGDPGNKTERKGKRQSGIVAKYQWSSPDRLSQKELCELPGIVVVNSSENDGNKGGEYQHNIHHADNWLGQVGAEIEYCAGDYQEKEKVKEAILLVGKHVKQQLGAAYLMVPAKLDKKNLPLKKFISVYKFAEIWEINVWNISG